MKQSVLVGRINVESAVCYIFEQLRYDKSKGIEGGFVPCILAGNDIHTCPILLALPRPNQVNGLCGGIFVRNSTTTDYDLKEHAWVFRQVSNFLEMIFVAFGSCNKLYAFSLISIYLSLMDRIILLRMGKEFS